MILIIKLTNGTEVVGELVKDTPAAIVLRDPFQINYKYFYGPLPSMSLAKYMMFTDNDTFVFNKDDYLHGYEARKPFADFYLLTASVFKQELAEKIDDELRDNVELRSSTDESVKEKHFKNLLESISPDDMSMN
jgi:hypothetical protein